MPHPDQKAAALSAEERRELAAQAQAELDALHDQIETLHDRVRPLAKLLDELRVIEDHELIADRDPGEVFTDPALLSEVTQREWNHGRGSRELDKFLTEAFVGLADGIMGFERLVADDYVTVTHLLPRLYLRRGQDVTELASALRRVHPALAVDGVMLVDILEHTCGENGSWHLELPTPETATLFRSRREHRSGTLEEMLNLVARDHYGVGYDY